MPIYMDRHIVPGIEAKHAAEAHREDLRIQDEYGCRCMTYWVDEERGNAFCLIDAPNKEAVLKMHNKAHGLISHEIIQVNSNVIEAFLGRIQDPEGYFDEDDPNLKIFNDLAFRIILVSEITDTRLLRHRLGKDKALQLLKLFNDIMHEQIKKYEGRAIENEGESFIASFVSVNQAVECASAIQKGLHIAAELINLRIGINAGMPVTKSKTLFGDTVKMARYLCSIGGENQILMASIIREIYKDNGHKDMHNKKRFNWISPVDEKFLQQLLDTLSNHWQDSSFDIDDFCHNMAISKSKLYRKCTALTGISPNSLIREYRLLKSLNLLKTVRNISQTTFDSGFSSPAYFSKCFLKTFGMLPSYYRSSM